MDLTIENKCEKGVDIIKPVSIKAGTTVSIQVNSIDTVTLEYIEKGLPPQTITKSHNTQNKLTFFRMAGNNVITLL